MYGAIGQKHVTLYPGMLPRVLGLEIAYIALSQHPDVMIKKSQIVLFVNIKVKVRSGCVSDRIVRQKLSRKEFVHALLLCFQYHYSLKPISLVVTVFQYFAWTSGGGCHSFRHHQTGGLKITDFIGRPL